MCNLLPRFEVNDDMEENKDIHDANDDMEERLNIKGNEELVESDPENPFQETSPFPLLNKMCTCFEHKKEFKYCSVQYTTNTILYCVHFNNTIDFDNFSKNNERYIPGSLRRPQYHDNDHEIH
uniref:Uncharacterized protein n=1 Tax=Rhabditophanes sp. KR3021 TaxID=114890 RepID=A0AC35THC9_9BILA